MCFLIVGCFHIQCHRNDSSDIRKVCVPGLGSGHRLANVALFHDSYTRICHLYVHHYQRQHPTGKTSDGFSALSDTYYKTACHMGSTHKGTSLQVNCSALRLHTVLLGVYKVQSCTFKLYCPIDKLLYP